MKLMLLIKLNSHWAFSFLFFFISSFLHSQEESATNWLQKTTTDAYEKFGIRDPAWDSDARNAMKYAQECWAWSNIAKDDAPDKAFLFATNAINRGCKDPLIHYIRLRFGSLMGKLNNTELRSIKTVTDEMIQSDYPAIRKAHTCAFAESFFANKINTFKDRELAQKYLQEMENWTVEALKDPEIYQEQVRFICSMLNNKYKNTKQDLFPSYERYIAALESSHPDSSLLYYIKGDFFVTYAWAARGGGYSNTVTREGWKLFEERLSKAAVFLEKAWEKDPKNSMAAARMISVEMGQGEGRQRMETWYQRAMEANPNNDDACEAKLRYLWPRWHGADHYVDAIKHAEECLKEGSPKSLVPHTWLVLTIDVRENQKEIAQQPIFWDNIQRLFEDYLKEYPASNEEKSCYAYWACQYEKWELANRLLNELGDNAWPIKFGGIEKLRELRLKATEYAARKEQSSAQ